MLIGLRDVESLLATARPGDYRAKVIQYWKDYHVFTALLGASKNRSKAKDPRVNFFQTDAPEIRAYINNGAGYLATDTSIAVDDGAGVGMARLFRKGDTLRYGTNLGAGELLLVTVDPADDITLEVARGTFGTTAVALVNNIPFIKIGDGQAEGGNSPTPVIDEPSLEYNFLEIFRDSWAWTDTMEYTETRFGEPEPARLQVRAMWQHAFKRELASLYGTRGTRTDPAFNTLIRKAGGFTSFLPASQIHDGSGASFTAAAARAWLRALIYGSAEKVVLCGATAFGVWQQYAATLGQVVIPIDTTTYGYRMRRFITDGPDLLFKVHPLLTRYAPGDSLIIDMAFVGESYQVDFKKEEVPQADTTERKKKQWRSEACLTFANPLAHSWVQGVTVYT